MTAKRLTNEAVGEWIRACEERGIPLDVMTRVQAAWDADAAISPTPELRCLMHLVAAFAATAERHADEMPDQPPAWAIPSLLALQSMTAARLLCAAGTPAAPPAPEPVAPPDPSPTT